MKFEKLNDTIPYAVGGKAKILRYSPYPNITIAMPGRHASNTVPKGGDFVVMVSDSIFDNADHQFKHDDIFHDIERRRWNENHLNIVMDRYLTVIRGGDANFKSYLKRMDEKELDPVTFIHAVQCLAVAEHRRYSQHELKFGGRYLPFRFAAGISEGLWTAEDAIATQRRGRLGVEYLEKIHGVPELSQELMA